MMAKLVYNYRVTMVMDGYGRYIDQFLTGSRKKKLVGSEFQSDRPTGSETEKAILYQHVSVKSVL